MELFANGGAWINGVLGTGTPQGSNDPKHPTKVAIEEENLTIDLHQEFAAVDLRYRMHNLGSRTKQDFFFPVESAEGGLDEYEIVADGKSLKVDSVLAEVTPEKSYPPKPIRAWKKSVISFGGNQTLEVRIRYKSAYGRESFSISEDCAIGNAIFAYSLSPAATWNGPIGKGKITVNIVHPEPWEVAFSKPADRFAKITETRYEWNFDRLKPTLEDDIEIIAHKKFECFPVDYAVGMRKSKIRGTYLVYDHRYYLVHCDYTAEASSTLKPQDGHQYEVQNIVEWDREKTWAEGVDGDGIGESITLKPKIARPLDAILINPGYGARDSAIFHDGGRKSQDESLWWQNNRVAQLEITLNGEHTFMAAFPDEIMHDPYPVLVHGYSKPVETIKMVIKAVYHGSKYQDTCISKVELRTKLTKKPKMGPCR